MKHPWSCFKGGALDHQVYLETELLYFGLLEKAREILADLGEKASLSYIKSSYHLLSKVYHPDMNPDNTYRAHREMKRLNRLSDVISRLSDPEIIEVIQSGMLSAADDRRRILVVEDEPGLLELYHGVLEAEGYRVMTAANGEEGLVVFRLFHPDLVFTDVIMPKTNGFEMVQAIRSEKPDTKVVYITGFLGVEGLRNKISAELSHFGYRILSKPFKISRMLDEIEEYLMGSTSETQFVKGLRSVGK
jgi:CheY-like chemotaxis protein